MLRISCATCRSGLQGPRRIAPLFRGVAASVSSSSSLSAAASTATSSSSSSAKKNRAGQITAAGASLSLLGLAVGDRVFDRPQGADRGDAPARAEQHRPQDEQAGIRRILSEDDRAGSLPTITASKGVGVGAGTELKARNVMIQRFQSVRQRDLGSKYRCDFEQLLGEGAYGTVHVAYDRATGEKVALKKISKRYTNSTSFRRETNALLRIYDIGGHPNISGLRDMYEDSTHFYLIIDLVKGGEMFEFLIRKGAFSEADAARLLKQVAKALNFLHGVGVVHADLKPENLMLSTFESRNAILKVVDFGCASVSEMGQIGSLADFSCDPIPPASAGTIAYWPPEAFTKGRNWEATASTDMWSLGIILFIMLTGLHPFDLQGNATDEDIKQKLLKNEKPPLHTGVTDHVSASALDLMEKLMNPDPTKRITAEQMLHHPWVRRGGASETIIEGSERRLERFQDLRHKLEAGIFAVMIEQGGKHDNAKNNPTKISLIERAFEVFDQEGKGFVSSEDLGRVVKHTTRTEFSKQEQRDMLRASTRDSNLSLSSFSKLLSHLKEKYYARGATIFKEGDFGDSMYFINSGTVEVSTADGQVISILRRGDFFGEGSLLHSNAERSSTIKALTPVDLIEITKKDFLRYIATSPSAMENLKVVDANRKLNRTKRLLRLQRNLKTHVLKRGDVVYHEGDTGHSMYIVDDLKGGELDVEVGGQKCVNIHAGEVFGEAALVFDRKRRSTVRCSSEKCTVHEMHGTDFLNLVESTPNMLACLRNMSRRREFQKAMSLTTRKAFSSSDLKEAFQAVDVDNNGTLSLNELKMVLKRVDAHLPESGEYLNFVVESSIMTFS
uniref:cGMP-dependent protein kinase n=1 Tax=Corethron hystrix TaxID=216773 RepID=A0A7S1BJJ1_9STRA|mmetsp:Transcript_30966/g.70797  ORF Transcript_30966/g.70797 Transcript_30966/m.70797 type:complete len:842 (+) Transcript_30966:149-2674(+)